MHKEQFKNILLVFLIMTNFVLGSKILIDKKLWPNGYNFFSNVGNIYTNIINYFSDDNQSQTQVFLPEKILINTGDQTTRISLNSGNSEFFEIYSEAEKILKSAFSASADNISPVSIEALYSTLSSDSIYLDFPTRYEIALFSDFLGAKENELSVASEEFSDIIITHSPKTIVYIADFENEKYFQINVSKNADNLITVCNNTAKRLSQSERPVINYSFDLGFDKPFGSQKTTLNPLIQIYSSVLPYPVIYSENPIVNEDLSVNEIIIDDILNVFNINPSIMNRYTEAGGTIVFVENNGILKIDTNGYLEYEAKGKGIELSSTNNRYTNIVNAAAIISKINKAAKNNASIIISQSEKANTFNFDYLISGLKMNVKTDKISSGIEIVIEDGYLKSYKQLIRNYKITDETTIPSEYFAALDTAIAEYSEFMNEIKIDKMYIGYTDDGAVGNKNANWIVDVNNIIAIQ